LLPLLDIDLRVMQLLSQSTLHFCQ